MADQSHEDKTALYLERLNEALESGEQQQIRSLFQELTGPDGP